VLKRYTWNTTITAQCFEDENGSAATGDWLFTTDFCWVRAQDFWESVSGRKFDSDLRSAGALLMRGVVDYRFPRCSRFV
jgi:hypothetical protein